MQSSDALERRISEVRRFNRFYTLKIGALRSRLLQSKFSLAEVRVLYELAHATDNVHAPPTASELAASLELDEGYLSRVLRGFERRGWVRRKRSADDRRKQLLQLTPRGRDAFKPLDARARAEVRALLSRLTESEQDELVGQFQTAERLLGRDTTVPALVLRPHRPGDLGWVIHRHGALYAREYGYDQRFEALVAQIAARFVERFDPDRERCWIAERDGRIIGSVFLVAKSRFTAKLRLLLVEPAARGLGVGTLLVAECVRFAREAGYRRIVLWTQSELDGARRIYQRAGFRRVGEVPHQSFGRDLVAETWKLALKRARSMEVQGRRSGSSAANRSGEAPPAGSATRVN